MVKSWENINEGDQRVLGFLQIDIVKSSGFIAPDIQQQRTKTNLRMMVVGILTSIYEAKKLAWPGDGGSFIFLLDSPAFDYDYMVTAALHVLDSMPFFNAMGDTHNFLGQDLDVRISCHEGRVNYSSNPETMHSDAINYFLKHERDIGYENTVTITEDVYNQLTNAIIKNMFQESMPHGYSLGGQSYEKKLYRSTGASSELLFANRLEKNKIKDDEILQTYQFSNMKQIITVYPNGFGCYQLEQNLNILSRNFDGLVEHAFFLDESTSESTKFPSLTEMMTNLSEFYNKPSFGFQLLKPLDGTVKMSLNNKTTDEDRTKKFKFRFDPIQKMGLGISYGWYWSSPSSYKIRGDNIFSYSARHNIEQSDWKLEFIDLNGQLPRNFVKEPTMTAIEPYDGTEKALPGPIVESSILHKCYVWESLKIISGWKYLVKWELR